ncbi:hypothetical protein KUTeg_016561 [Tegillarca granosa]|uniref:Peptidase M16 middle/third domain-containing protein n=1 Tax=Tegillarca granosa TaxID=220873 RepID=A0ABQ9ENR5_TEGGR|nr:hypothetical protein KUTeg_016561 [Tegillarca granosa]
MQLIRDCIEQLQPDRCNFILCSQNFKNQDICQNEEYWYKTKYCSTDIEPQLIQSWTNPPDYSELSLPPPNRFIGKSCIYKKYLYLVYDFVHPYPELRIEDKFCKLWYKKDTKFNVPKGSVYVHFTTPVVNRTLQRYNIEGLDTGLVVTLKGFNHKIQDLFQLILDEIFTFTCSDGLFDMMKEQLKKTYQNELLQPYELASMLKFSVIKPVYWPLSERVNAIDDVTKDMMEDFIKELLSHLFVEGFLSGNFTPENVTAFGNSLKTKLVNNKALPNIDHLKQA